MKLKIVRPLNFQHICSLKIPTIEPLRGFFQKMSLARQNFGMTEKSSRIVKFVPNQRSKLKTVFLIRATKPHSFSI